MDERINSVAALFDGRLFCYQLSSVIQLAFTGVRTVAYVGFTGGGIGCKSCGYRFIVGPALGAALLRMSAFGIWHNY
jgi:hypothetical protein